MIFMDKSNAGTDSFGIKASKAFLFIMKWFLVIVLLFSLLDKDWLNAIEFTWGVLYINTILKDLKKNDGGWRDIVMLPKFSRSNNPHNNQKK